MIDWYVLLTPLVLLPIVLLFVFVGCSITTSGTADDVFTPVFSLRYSSSIAATVGLDSITITITRDSFETGTTSVSHTYTSVPGTSPSGTIFPVGFSLQKEGGTIQFWVWDAPMPAVGVIDCTCQLTFLADGAPRTAGLPAPVPYRWKESETESRFELVTDGALGFAVKPV